MNALRSAALPLVLSVAIAAISSQRAVAQSTGLRTFELTKNTAGWTATSVAVHGQTAYVLENGAASSHRILVFDSTGIQVAPTLVDTIQSTIILGDLDWNVTGITASASGVQGIATNVVEQRSVFVMWTPTGTGTWSEETVQLSGVEVGEGTTLSFDGRSWAALSFTGSSSLFVDLAVIDRNGKPFIYQTLPVGVGETTAPDRPMAVAHDEGIVAVRACADPLGLVYIFENLPTSGWSLNGVLGEVFADAVPTTAALDVRDGQIGVGRDLGATFQQHIGIVYGKSQAGEWSPIDLLELPGAASPNLDRRNLTTLRMTEDRVWLSQGESASSHSYLSVGGSSPYVLDMSIRGIGGPIAVASGCVSGLTAFGSAIALSDSKESCSGIVGPLK